MKQLIFTGWNFFRVFRLIISVIILLQAFAYRDGMLGMMGLLFAATAIFNTGCCGSGTCGLPEKTKVNNQSEIIYEKVDP